LLGWFAYFTFKIKR